MTEEEINIAIATACGKKYHRPTEKEISSGSYYQYQPNYYRSLNAMHEAEKVLKEGREQDAYAAALGDLTGGRQIDLGAMRINATTKIIFATAAQRAEAFLRTRR